MNQWIHNRIEIYQGDITKITNVDAIVCNTNKKLVPIKSNKNKVDFQIHAAAGECLKEECKQLGEAKLGEAKITSACNLRNNSVKYIIHTVGPHHYRMTRVEAEKVLADCYRNCLELAKKKELKTIVFPCIGLDDEEYQNKEHAVIAYRTVYRWMRSNDDCDIIVIFCCYTTQDYDIYQNIKAEEYYLIENCIADRGHKDSIGLVLAGGGAKGAFEIGAWEVLRAKGIDQYITGISGTSIGAINTALIMSNLTKNEIEKIWLDFEQSKMMDEQYMSKRIKEATASWGFHPKFSMDLFSTIVKSPKYYNSNNFSKYYAVFEGERYYVSWKGKSAEKIRQLVMDSARHQRLYSAREDNDGNVYVDGGTHDFLRKTFPIIPADTESSNVPIQPLYDIGYRKFIVIYCEDNYKVVKNIIAKETERYADATFCRIIPLKSLGDMSTINQELTKSRIRIGRESADMQLINGKYGIDAIRWWNK